MNINFSLKNKNIILTGAAGILGQKLSQAYLDAGANLALLDINKNELNKLQKILAQKNNYFNTYHTDITKEDQINKTIKSIVKKFVSIDVLHNNAATKGNSIEEFLKPFEQYKLATWNNVINGNLSSMFIMTKLVGKYMKKQNYGNIIQTASIYGVIPPDKNIYRNSFITVMKFLHQLHIQFLKMG